MRSLRYTPRSIQRAYSVHVAPPSSASNEKSQTGSSAVACVSPVARWKITQNSPIAGLYKCTHTHTHNLSRNSLIVFTVLGHAYTRRNLIRGQTPIGLYACGWHTMSCANEGAKVPDVSCLYNDNEGAQVQVKHAWVHLQHVGPNWRLHQAGGGYSSLPECRCVCT